MQFVTVLATGAYGYTVFLNFTFRKCIHIRNAIVMVEQSGRSPENPIDYDVPVMGESPVLEYMPSRLRMFVESVVWPAYSLPPTKGSPQYRGSVWIGKEVFDIGDSTVTHTGRLGCREIRL
jgi:hypothetical protein